VVAHKTTKGGGAMMADMVTPTLTCAVAGLDNTTSMKALIKRINNFFFITFMF
jgi:hypothetical protein